MFGRLLREPLLHFVVLGVLLFAAYRWQSEGAPEASVIELGPREIAALAADHERRHGMPPTAAERQALIDRFVEDELLYREALALGLDRGDMIVRRRLLQKMEFLLEGRADLVEPTLEDLQTQRDTHADRYRMPARVDFRHVFVSRDRPGAGADAAAVAARAALDAGVEPTTLGDPFVHGHTFRLRSESDLARTFGTDFATRVMALEAGRWSAPIASSYGLHLVHVDAHTDPALPPVDAIRATLTEDWLERRRADAMREAVAELRRHYEIRIHDGAEKP